MIEFLAGLIFWVVVITNFYMIGLVHSKWYDYECTWYDKIGVGIAIGVICSCILWLVYVLYLLALSTGQSLLS